jgi:hypothetical protein
MVDKLKYTEKTILYYASGKVYGLLYLAMSIMKFDLKVKDFNKIIDEFPVKTAFEKAENKKLLIAKSIISEYIEKYLEEKQAEKERSQK